MRRRRRQYGNAIAEFGPAIFILFLVVFFPLLDLLGFAMAYGTCWYLNSTISNEVARARETRNAANNAPTGQTIASQEVAVIMNTGFASFLKLKQGDIVPQITYNNKTSPPTVDVTTTISNVQPFLKLPTIPSFKPIPGINAAYSVTIYSQVTREITL